MVSNVSQAQLQQIDCPGMTAKLREALDKQIVKHEKHQSILSCVTSWTSLTRLVFTIATPSWSSSRAF
eukprot:986068-Pleurochrysis_carterae.AAC.3